MIRMTCMSVCLLVLGACDAPPADPPPMRGRPPRAAKVFSISSRPDPAAAAEEQRRRIISAEHARQPRVLVFTASWCVPCRRLHAALDYLTRPELGWRVGPGPEHHFELIDATNLDHPAIEAFRVTEFPTLIRVDGGREVSRVEGLFDPAAAAWPPARLAWRLSQFANGTWSPAPREIDPEAQP